MDSSSCENCDSRMNSVIFGQIKITSCINCANEKYEKIEVVEE